MVLGFVLFTRGRGGWGGIVFYGWQVAGFSGWFFRVRWRFDVGWRWQPLFFDGYIYVGFSVVKDAF